MPIRCVKNANSMAAESVGRPPPRQDRLSNGPCNATKHHNSNRTGEASVGVVKRVAKENREIEEVPWPQRGGQISQTAMTNPATSTAAPSATQSPRCFSIRTLIHSP